MSTWFPEKPPDDEHPDRSERPQYGRQRAESPTPASGDFHALPTRRSVQAAQEARLGRGGSIENEDTQFMPPFTDEEDQPGGAGPQGMPAYPGEPAGGSLYESSGRSARSGGGRRVAGGPAVPPGGRDSSSLGAATAVPPPEGSTSGLPPFQDLAPGRPPFPDPGPDAPSGAAPGATFEAVYGQRPPGPAGGYPDPPPPGPADPKFAGQPYPESAGGAHRPPLVPMLEPDPSAGRPQDGDVDGNVPGQFLSRVLAAFAWPVMTIGLFVPESGDPVFSRMPTWSAFALLCLVLVGVGAFGGPKGPGAGRTFTLGVIGAGGLVAFWVLLVLPEIQRNTSFVLTLGTTLAAFAMWLTRQRG